MSELIHVKRQEKKKDKNKNKGPVNGGYQGYAGVSHDFEVPFKWVAIDAERVSSKENAKIYEEYKELRPQLLRATVYNEDGSENAEGIARLRMAGLDDKNIFDVVGKGMTPNGYNYHHIFPRALSGGMKKGPVQYGAETLTTVHDWRALVPLPNDLHANVHKAMDKRNGPIPQNSGEKKKYYIAVPLSAAEYQQYKENPASVKQDLLIVSGDSYREMNNLSASKAAVMKRLATNGR